MALVRAVATLRPVGPSAKLGCSISRCLSAKTSSAVFHNYQQHNYLNTRKHTRGVSTKSTPVMAVGKSGKGQQETATLALGCFWEPVCQQMCLIRLQHLCLETLHLVLLCRTAHSLSCPVCCPHAWATQVYIWMICWACIPCKHIFQQDYCWIQEVPTPSPHTSLYVAMMDTQSQFRSTLIPKRCHMKTCWGWVRKWSAPALHLVLHHVKLYLEQLPALFNGLAKIL